MIRWLKQLWCAHRGHPYPTIDIPIVGPRPQDGETDQTFCSNCSAWLGPSPIIEALKARIQKLEKLLEPFAENADRYAIGSPETPGQFQVYVTLADCRNARAALSHNGTRKET